MSSTVYQQLGLETVGRRAGSRPRKASAFETNVRSLAAAAIALNLESGAVHLAAEIAALEPAYENDDELRFALIVLIVMSQLALSEGSTRLVVGDAGQDGALTRSLAALTGHFLDQTQQSRLARDIARILAPGNAAAVIGRNADARRPLLLIGPHLYHEKIFRAEERLARRIASMVPAEPVVSTRAIADAIADVAARPAMPSGVPHVLSTDQLRAVETAAASRLAVISGGPGTGKTSIVAALLRVLVRINVNPALIALAAPTGKAAYRLNESIQADLRAIKRPSARDTRLAEAILPSSTIHRLLGYSGSHRSLAHHAGNPLEADVVLVDEASMIDLTMMDRLAGALRTTTRLIILGDADQLPSVAAGDVLRDLVPSSDRAAPAPCVVLHENFRTRSAAASGREIAETSHWINEGRSGLLTAAGSPIKARARVDEIAFSGVEFLAAKPELLPEFLTRFVQDRIDSAEYAAMAERIYDLGGKNAESDAATLSRMLQDAARQKILCVTRIGPLGADEINARMHRAALRRAGISDRRAMVAGEPVIVLRNDYDHMLFNGDQGVVVKYRGPRGREATGVAFIRGSSPDLFPVEMLGDAIDLCYAMTVHKAQGSEFARVALILPDRESPLLSREIIYTAVSRAIHSCTIFGAPEMIERAVANRIPRSSGLRAAIEKFRTPGTRT